MARAPKTTSKAPDPVAEETTKPDTSERARLLTMGQKKDKTDG
jgi:hypothetical protein